MNRSIIILILLGIVGCAHTGGNAFILKDKTGKESGPFWFREGRTITIGAESATIHKILCSDDILVQKLKDRIIPQIEFKDADIRDVIDFFKEPRIVESEQDEISDPPINIVLVLPAGKTPADMGIPLITWEAHSLSTYDALRTLARMTGLDFKVKDNHVWLAKKK